MRFSVHNAPQRSSASSPVSTNATANPNISTMLPRIEAYLSKGLAHPALVELRGWYETYMPRVLGSSKQEREPS